MRDSLPRPAELRELLLSLDEPLRLCRCCSTKPPPVRWRAASELLARSDEGRPRCGDDGARRLLCCREEWWPSAAEAMMDRALRSADDDRPALLEMLLSLALDSTTLGIMKPGVERGTRARWRCAGACEPLLLLRSEEWRRGGEAAAMLSGVSSAPPSPEDPFSVVVGDCRPPCERGRSRSRSLLRACCAWVRGAVLGRLRRSSVCARCSCAAACFDNVSEKYVINTNATTADY